MRKSHFSFLKQASHSDDCTEKLNIQSLAGYCTVRLIERNKNHGKSHDFKLNA